MLIVELTEASARFITGLILVLIAMAILGWLSQATGLNLVIIIGIVLFAFGGFIFWITKGPKASNAISSEWPCNFIRANGTQCVNPQSETSEYCEYHAKPPKIVEPVPIPAPRAKRSQCGFVREDGSKCKKLKPVEIPRCDQHLNLDGVAGN